MTAIAKCYEVSEVVAEIATSALFDPVVGNLCRCTTAFTPGTLTLNDRSE